MLLLDWGFFTILCLLCQRHHISAVVSARSSSELDPPIPSLKSSLMNLTSFASPILAHNSEEDTPSGSKDLNSDSNCNPETETECWRGCCPFPNMKCCDMDGLCPPQYGFCPCHPETDINCSWGCCSVPPGENWVCCEGPNIHGCSASQNDCP